LVNFTKWVVIAAGLVFLGLFTQEAAASGLTGTLKRTGLAGSSIGGGLAAIGRGGGAGFSGLLQPFWEIRNIVRGFMNLGSATPWLEDTPAQGGGTNETTGDGGGSDPVPVAIEQGVPDIYTGAGFTYYNDPRISPSPITNTVVKWDTGITRDLPLSAEAVKWYQDLGVEVTPQLQQGGGTNQTTGGGGGNWGSNVSTPSGGVASGNLSLGSWGA
jgi:hypothetical protein